MAQSGNGQPQRSLGDGLVNEYHHYSAYNKSFHIFISCNRVSIPLPYFSTRLSAPAITPRSASKSTTNPFFTAVESTSWSTDTGQRHKYKNAINTIVIDWSNFETKTKEQIFGEESHLPYW